MRQRTDFDCTQSRPEEGRGDGAGPGHTGPWSWAHFGGRGRGRRGAGGREKGKGRETEFWRRWGEHISLKEQRTQRQQSQESSWESRMTYCDVSKRTEERVKTKTHRLKTFVGRWEPRGKNNKGNRQKGVSQTTTSPPLVSPHWYVRVEQEEPHRESRCPFSPANWI